MGFSVKYLPNVADFKILLGSFDRIFQIFGLTTRVAPALEFSGWLNAKANKFVYYRMKRLFILSNKCTTNKSLAVQFWKEA